MPTIEPGQPFTATARARRGPDVPEVSLVREGVRILLSEGHAEELGIFLKLEGANQRGDTAVDLLYTALRSAGIAPF